MKINQETKKNILTITYAGVVLFVILYFSKVIGFLASIWQLLVPFIIGFAKIHFIKTSRRIKEYYLLSLCFY